MSERKHSGVGIASFIIAVVSILGLSGSVIAATAMAAAMAGDSIAISPDTVQELPEGMGGLLAVAGLMFFLIVAALVGAVLGLVGLFQKERLKLFSILGLTFNSLLVLVVFIVLVVGMLSAPALPGTFGSL